MAAVGRRHHPRRHPRPDLPAADRRRPHLRRREGLTDPAHPSSKQGDVLAAITMQQHRQEVRRRLPGRQRRQPRHRRRRVHDPRRPVGLREVDPAADDRRPRGHHLRRHDHRRQAGQRQGAPRPQPGDGVPELRALPAPDGVREHRVPAAAPQALPDDEIDARSSEAADDARAHRAPRPQAGATSRAASASGWRWAGRSCATGRRVPVRRAAVQPRRQAARPDAHRDPPAAAPARHHDRLRHPRPDRGHDPRRPGGGAAQGRAPAGRHARGSSTSSRSTCSSPASSARRR